MLIVLLDIARKSSIVAPFMWKARAREWPCLAGRGWSDPDHYYKEFAALDEAMDQTIVTDLSRAITTGLGPFSNARVVREVSELAPDVLENKIYASGVGLILELVSFTIP